MSSPSPSTAIATIPPAIANRASRLPRNPARKPPPPPPNPTAGAENPTLGATAAGALKPKLGAGPIGAEANPGANSIGDGAKGPGKFGAP